MICHLFHFPWKELPTAIQHFHGIPEPIDRLSLSSLVQMGTMQDPHQNLGKSV